MASKAPVKPITQIAPPRAESATFRYRLWLLRITILGFTVVTVFIWLPHLVRRIYRFHSWDW